MVFYQCIREAEIGSLAITESKESFCIYCNSRIITFSIYSCRRHLCFCLVFHFINQRLNKRQSRIHYLFSVDDTTRITVEGLCYYTIVIEIGHLIPIVKSYGNEIIGILLSKPIDGFYSSNTPTTPCTSCLFHYDTTRIVSIRRCVEVYGSCTVSLYSISCIVDLGDCIVEIMVSTLKCSINIETNCL